MAKIAIIYGTGEGQTQMIAERIAEVARSHGHLIVIKDARETPLGFPLEDYDAVIIGAPIHAGRYPDYIGDFVKRQRAYLDHTPSAFFTVCLAAKDHTAAAQAQVQQYITEFEQATGWIPAKTGAFAGALRYTRYSFPKRFMVRMIARRQGNDIDTSRDWEYTDWEAVKRFAEEYAAAVDWAVTPFAMA